MKARSFHLLTALLMTAVLASCTKDECVEPKQSNEGSEKALMEQGRSTELNGTWNDTESRDPQAFLRNGDDLQDPDDGAGEGGGISDDGDDTSDTEKSNRKGN